MSSFSAGALKVDANGNLATEKLEKELSSALKFDVEYKQKDNMKKRAIKVATDYDQFKAMVDCSHLKKITSKEVQSLGDRKQGWSREYRADTSNDANILLSEETMSTNLAGQNLTPLSFNPTSSAALERELVSLTSFEEKILYLKEVGSKQIKKLIKKDCNAELFDQLLKTITFSIELEARLPSGKENDGEEQGELNVAITDNSANEKQGSNDNDNDQGEEEVVKPLNVLKWLRVLSMSNRFALTLQFVGKDMRTACLEYITSRCAEDELINSYK
jgi:hypothetical protein